MAKELKLNLPSANDLFSTQEEREDAQREKVVILPIAEIDDFPDHPYPVEMDEEMQDTVESVKAYGVHTPALVRPKEDGRYEMVSGHRRKMASELAERDIMPCIVRNLTDDEVTIIMVDSNLQREKVPLSAKAKAYKMKLDAIRRVQGERIDLTCVPVGHKLENKRSRELLAEKSPDSNTQIQRLIRLTELIPEVLQMVDAGKIAMRPAVELSYLPAEQQKALLDTMELEDCTPSHAQAIKLREFSKDGRLDENVILSIMQEEKPNQKEQFKIPHEKLSRFFTPGTPVQKMESDIVKGLELLQRQREKKREGLGL